MRAKPDTKPLRLNLSQILVLILIGINLCALIISTKATSDGASKDNKVFSSIGSMARSFSLLQRETLVYTTKLAQWGAGDVQRKEVDTARLILEQRLVWIQENDAFLDQFPELAFFKVLKKSDEIVATANQEFLTSSEQVVIQNKLKDIIAKILAFSSKFALTYRLQLDQQLSLSADDRQNKADANLILLLFFSFLSSIFIFTFIYRQNNHFKIINDWLQEQLVLLGAAQVDLKKSGSLVEKFRLLDERKNIFISTINHELRTPLTSIIGYVSLLRESGDNKLSAESIRMLDVIDRNSLTLLTLVEETLTLSSLESNSTELEKEVIAVTTILSEAIQALSPEALGFQSAFEVDIEDGIDTAIFANPNAMSQAFSNILYNALKFSQGESKVAIKVRQRLDHQRNQFIQIAVRDQGIGIPESQLSEIFSEFYRAPNAISSGIPGTGLGLAITLRIIELHQGSIKVKSEVGKGSTFTIELPSHVSAITKMINERRSAVLERAITALETCSLLDLEGTCHEMIGALGFYEYESLSAEIKLFSDWLKARDSSNTSELPLRRVELLDKLRRCGTADENLGGELELEI